MAVDLSGWIARATHGQGGRLLDYRTLTAYGRAELAGTVATDASSGDGRGRGANAGGGDPEGDGAFLDARARDVEYVASCCRQIVARVVCLRAQGRADVLAVLDGCSPPSKRGEVGRRRGRREAERRPRRRPRRLPARTETWRRVPPGSGRRGGRGRLPPPSGPRW